MRLLVTAISAAVLAMPAAARAQQAVRAQHATGCMKATVVLHTIVAFSPIIDAGLPYGLQVDVLSANANGRAYLRARQPVTVMIGPTTRLTGDVRSLGDLQWSRHVAVLARVCDAKLARGATPMLSAVRVTPEA